MVKYPKEYLYNDHIHDQSYSLMIINNGEVKMRRRFKSKLICLIWLSFLCFGWSLFWISQVFASSLTLTHLLFVEEAKKAKNNVGICDKVASLVNLPSNPPPIPSSSSNGGRIYCDRSQLRTDICWMKGDIRTQSCTSSIYVYKVMNQNINNISNNDPQTSSTQEMSSNDKQHERIKPYTRKWETNIMNTIDELHLISTHKPSNFDHNCDVLHDVPAVIFSTGGYTGNVYHEFNDGIIPLYITSQHFKRKVVFVILEYHNWWYTKYEKVLYQLTHYPLINFNSDLRTHCFKEAIVGLKIHNELTIDPSLMQGNKSMIDFHNNLLGRAFDPSPPSPSPSARNPPKLVIFARKGTRSITNQRGLVKLAEKVGFNVEVLNPTRKTGLGDIYRALSTSDVMIGVHGAAMTHFLFLKPTSVLIQIIPLGTDWPSETYYGEPAKRYGLKYKEYKIRPRESSLYNKYNEDDPIIRDPNSIAKKGWEYTKSIYLGDQNVTLDLKRFRTLLVQAYQDCMHTSRKITTNS